MKAGVIGTGKTGGRVVSLLGDEAVAFNSEHKPDVESLKKMDLAIIFVPGNAAEEIQELLLKAKIPSVWGTTGYVWPENLNQRVKNTGTKWVLGSNFSLSMNLLRKSIEIFGKGSELLNSPKFHIHEVHHIHKKDAPSGTALSWKEWLGREAEITSEREGDIKGIHQLHIQTKNESIFLKHKAKNRNLFAEGAIWSARYLLKNRELNDGVYQFSDLFDRALKETML